MSEKKLKRFSVSMDETLLTHFDQWVGEKGLENRSEAVRNLVRDALVQKKWEDDDQYVAGSILLFYDHHQRDVLHELTEIQHKMHNAILATTHFHLDPNNCLEIIVVRGTSLELRQLSDQLIGAKGVKYGKFTVAPVADPAI